MLFHTYPTPNTPKKKKSFLFVLNTCYFSEQLVFPQSDIKRLKSCKSSAWHPLILHEGLEGCSCFLSCIWSPGLFWGCGFAVGQCGLSLEEGAFPYCFELSVGCSDSFQPASGIVRLVTGLGSLVYLKTLHKLKCFSIALSFQVFVYDSLLADSGKKTKLEAMLCQLQQLSLGLL